MTANASSPKPEEVTNIECLVLILFGGYLSMGLLRVAMWIYDDYLVRASAVEGSAIFWLIGYALLATWAIIQRRRSP
jgi:hypothetical protein